MKEADTPFNRKLAEKLANGDKVDLMNDRLFKPLFIIEETKKGPDSYWYPYL